MAESRFARNIRHVHRVRLSEALTRPAMLAAFRPPSIQVENELLATRDARDGSPKSNSRPRCQHGSTCPRSCAAARAVSTNRHVQVVVPQ